ncbi:MAG TPA: hypothetical protein VIS96_10370 [Terrimicrobiaceae bacterium]
MSLLGLPDYQRPLHGFRYQIYYPFENSGSFVVTSSQLEIGITKAGRPDFLLEMVRGASPAMPPKPYAVLDFRVRAVHPTEDALALVRKEHPNATVAPPVFRGGFLRLQPAANTGAMPEELSHPVPLAGNGLGVARFVMRLGSAAGAVIEGALKGEVLGLLAWAEMEMEGVGPRVPVSVTFNPADLLHALAKLAGNPAAPVLTRDQLEGFFEQDLNKLPLRLDGSLEDTSRRDFVEAMADLLRVRYGDFVASQRSPVEFSISLRMQEASAGQVTWDLSKPLMAPRAIIASLDPFDAARQLVKSEGIASFVKQTVVPPLSSGTKRVHVAANLPSARAGVLSLGVHVSAPPKPPHRMQAIQETLELVAPSDSGVVTMKMSAAEPFAYEYTTWAVAERAGAVERLESPRRNHEGPTLDLSVDDFPARFVTVEASAALLHVATITGTCAGNAKGRPFERRFELTRDNPAVGIGVPTEATLAPLQVQAVERDGAKVLRLTLEAAQSAQLDLTSFPEFGPHRVKVECDFGEASSGFLAVDLVAEGSEESPGAVQTLALTPAAPTKEWGYLASSPFRAGYRYRIHAASGDSPSRWSDVQQPTTPLVLQVSANHSNAKRATIKGLAPD